MWRVPSKRIKLDLDGPTVEVEPIHAWSIQIEGLALANNYNTAKNAQAEYVALSALFDYVARESQLQWDIADHEGPVPPTARGLARLPLRLAVQIVEAWLATLAEDKPQSAVDAVVPPGPVNKEIKRRLRSVKAA